MTFWDWWAVVYIIGHALIIAFAVLVLQWREYGAPTAYECAAAIRKRGEK